MVRRRSKNSKRQFFRREIIVKARGQLVLNDRKATVSQMCTLSIGGIQKNIFKRTTHWTLMQMVYISRRPHRMPLLSIRIKNWGYIRLVWSVSNSATTSGGRVISQSKQHENRRRSCLVSTVQTGIGGVMVVFSWHLAPVNRLLTLRSLPRADHVAQFMTTLRTHPLSASSSRTRNSGRLIHGTE